MHVLQDEADDALTTSLAAQGATGTEAPGNQLRSSANVMTSKYLGQIFGGPDCQHFRTRSCCILIAIFGK